MSVKTENKVMREIIKIDEEKCTGCGYCVPGCPEGALQIIDGKARLVSDLFCDGLGACIGECPENAISVEKREAEEYDERRVMQNVVKQGKNTISAHLKHLSEHGESGFLNEAISYLKENNIDVPEYKEKEKECRSEHSACPSLTVKTFEKEKEREAGNEEGKRPSELRQFPLQLHLIAPNAPFLKKSDLLLSADCVAYAFGDFHKDFLKGKTLAIACPKLDTGIERYVEKLSSMIDDAEINTITLMIMEVPCCSGLLRIVNTAREKSKRHIPVKVIVVSRDGKIIKEEWQ